jgi:hypothetical protein
LIRSEVESETIWLSWRERDLHPVVVVVLLFAGIGIKEISFKHVFILAFEESLLVERTGPRTPVFVPHFDHFVIVVFIVYIVELIIASRANAKPLLALTFLAKTLWNNERSVLVRFGLLGRALEEFAVARGGSWRHKVRPEVHLVHELGLLRGEIIFRLVIVIEVETGEVTILNLDLWSVIVAHVQLWLLRDVDSSITLASRGQAHSEE